MLFVNVDVSELQGFGEMDEVVFRFGSLRFRCRAHFQGRDACHSRQAVAFTQVHHFDTLRRPALY